MVHSSNSTTKIQLQATIRIIERHDKSGGFIKTQTAATSTFRPDGYDLDVTCAHQRKKRRKMFRSGVLGVCPFDLGLIDLGFVSRRGEDDNRPNIGEEAILSVGNVRYVYRNVNQSPFQTLLVLKRRHAPSTQVENRKGLADELLLRDENIKLLLDVFRAAGPVLHMERRGELVYRRVSTNLHQQDSDLPSEDAYPWPPVAGLNDASASTTRRIKL